MTNTLSFDAALPSDSSSPVKPTRDTDVRNGVLRRRTRVWIDAWLEPGDLEMLLLFSESPLRVTIEAKAF